MLLIVLLLSAGLFFLPPGFALAQRKPAIKADRLQALTMALLSAWLVTLFWKVFLIFVATYGFSFAGITFGAEFSYGTLAVLGGLIGLMVYAAIISSERQKLSLALVGIQKSHAVPVLYRTLERMGLPYSAAVSDIGLPDMNLNIGINLSAHEIRFRVSRPLDKLFLYRLCRVYREEYRSLGFPIARMYAARSALMAAICLAASGYLAVDWLTVTFAACY